MSCELHQCEDTAMRLMLFIPAVIVAMAAAGRPAEAQNYPWCAQYAGAGGGAQNCGFVSFEQCVETVRGMGGFCQQNTLYTPPAGTGPGRRVQQKPRTHS